jgi:hypothetical protein
MTPGKIVLDLAVAVALGGDCLADIGVLRAEPGLFGPVASDPVVSRLVTQLAADAPAAMTAIGKARSAARERRLETGRRCGARHRRRADPGRHRRHDRDRALLCACYTFLTRDSAFCRGQWLVSCVSWM